MIDLILLFTNTWSFGTGGSLSDDVHSVVLKLFIMLITMDHVIT